MRNADSIARAVLVVVFGYALALGGTFNGLVEPQFRPPQALRLSREKIVLIGRGRSGNAAWRAGPRPR